jgi:hypothetical protein
LGAWLQAAFAGFECFRLLCRQSQRLGKCLWYCAGLQGQFSMIAFSMRLTDNYATLNAIAFFLPINDLVSKEKSITVPARTWVPLPWASVYVVSAKPFLVG